MFGIQEPEQVLSLEDQKQQELKHFVSGDAAGLFDVCLTEHLSELELADCIGKLNLGIFILAHLVYHKISTSSVLVGLMWQSYCTKD